MKIQGLVQTLTPIHITAPQDSMIKRGNETMTVTFPLFDYEAGKTAYIPGISATHLRGALRRIASDIYIERLRKAGMQIPAALYNAQRHGATGGTPNQNARRGIDFSQQLKDPIMALFGGGPMMLPGHVGASWMLPVTRETVAANIVQLPHYLDPEKLPEAWRLIGEGTAYSSLDMLRGQDVADLLSDYVETITAIIAAMDSRRNAKKGETAAEDAPEQDKRRGSNILAYRYLLAGVLLNVNLRCDDDLPAAAKGLFLEVARIFFEAGRVGGFQRIGFGEQAFNLHTVSGLTLDGEPVFETTGDALELALSSNSQIAEWHKAYRAWCEDPSTLDCDEMLASAGITLDKMAS